MRCCCGCCCCVRNEEASIQYYYYFFAFCFIIAYLCYLKFTRLFLPANEIHMHLHTLNTSKVVEIILFYFAFFLYRCLTVFALRFELISFYFIFDYDLLDADTCTRRHRFTIFGSMEWHSQTWAEPDFVLHFFGHRQQSNHFNHIHWSTFSSFDHIKIYHIEPERERAV